MKNKRSIVLDILTRSKTHRKIFSGVWKQCKTGGICSCKSRYRRIGIQHLDPLAVSVFNADHHTVAGGSKQRGIKRKGSGAESKLLRMQQGHSKQKAEQDRSAPGC